MNDEMADWIGGTFARVSPHGFQLFGRSGWLTKTQVQSMLTAGRRVGGSAGRRVGGSAGRVKLNG
jgi:hypothetical protein